MPIATPQGTLDFKSVDKVTFVGASSNTVIDTTTGSLGVGVGVGGPTSNLHVVGNALITGNVSDLNVVSNVNMLHTSNTASIKLNSNVVTEFPRSKKLIKYPRVNLTQNALNNGYAAAASSENTSTSRYAFNAFNSNLIDEWQLSGVNNDPNQGYNITSPFDANSNSPTISVVNGGSYTGAWIKIQLPDAIRVLKVRMHLPDVSSSRRPDKAVVLGSNDDTNWYNLSNEFVIAFGSSGWANIDINSPVAYYKHIKLLVTSLASEIGVTTGQLQLRELEYYGTPEYDPEAHGTDVVVKSVPNVPNTDWLDIYIDGQDYTSMPSGSGSVLDKSTNNRHGTPSNVTFNSTWKAFEIESASTSNITVPFNSTGGAYVHTIALWFLMDTTAGGNRCIFTIRGSESTGKQIALIINQDTTTVGFKYDFYSADIRYYDPSVVANKWMHCVVTYSGGANNVSKEIYLDGVKLPAYGTSTSPLALTGTENLIIGGNLNSGNASFEGMVANFRMFNRVLTSDEIYQLYAYQKEYFGHGDLGMSLKAGRLGIGTSEPRVALDVRGDILGGCPIYFAAYNTNGASAGNTVIWNELWISRGGGYDTGTGIFTAPLAGIYKFYYTLRQSGGTTASLYARVQLNGSDVSNNYGAIYLSTTRDQAGSTVLFKLNAGDEISVKVYNNDMASAYSSFVGEYFSSL